MRSQAPWGWLEGNPSTPGDIANGGVLQQVGSVAEYIASDATKYPQGANIVLRHAPLRKDIIVVRGGAWRDSHVDGEERQIRRPEERDPVTGFRLVLAQRNVQA
jgi:hypothetical protein